MKNWYYLVWNNYLIYVPSFNNENECYLIIDKATSHITNNIINLLKSGNREVSFIPSGLTRFLQTLDFAINKLFKQALKEQYIVFCIKNGNENKKVSRTAMIDFIVKIWYNDAIITKVMIKVSE